MVVTNTQLVVQNNENRCIVLNIHHLNRGIHQSFERSSLLLVVRRLSTNDLPRTRLPGGLTNLVRGQSDQQPQILISVAKYESATSDIAVRGAGVSTSVHTHTHSLPDYMSSVKRSVQHYDSSRITHRTVSGEWMTYGQDTPYGVGRLGGALTGV